MQTIAHLDKGLNECKDDVSYYVYNAFPDYMKYLT